MSALLNRMRKEDPENLKRAIGRPRCEAAHIAERFGVTRRRVMIHGVDVLNRCADDAARRLLLGCSR
jgi:hypothetical protein